MNDITDTINLLNLEAWNATDTGVLSHIKSPLQQTFFTSNSDLIGQALRQSIIYFAETLNTTDRYSCLIGNEFRSTRTHRYQVPRVIDDKSSETTTPMDVTTYAPIAFEQLRTMIGISRNDFQSSFNNGDLINFANTGRSGSQMYKTFDDVYIIKTLRDHEAKLLIQSLSGLYLRYSSTSSLMTRYVGLYSVNIRSVFSSEIFCVVMVNNLPSMLNIHELYDLKGSSKNRKSTLTFRSSRLKALKDEDFQTFYPSGIRLPHDVYRRLRLTLESDIFELRKLMITDFSLMLGVYHLDEYLQDEQSKTEVCRFKPKPELGATAIFELTNIDRTVVISNKIDETNGKTEAPDTALVNKFIMKPLHLILCPQEETFSDDTTATSFLGIPGVTHDGRRVLLYPALIDCLQTFDSFKRIQHAIQNIRDPKQSSEYSVIHPDGYEKRLLRLLFEKVFIDSKQTLEELLASPIAPISIDQMRQTSELLESYEVVQITETECTDGNDEEIIQTTEVIQNLTLSSLTSNGH